MVFGLRIARQSEAADKALEEHVRNIAAFPLAIPLMAAPARSPRRCCWPDARAAIRSARALIGIIAAIMAACLIVFLAAAGSSACSAVTGNTVLSRLLGVLLAAMAVQFVIDGVRAA